MSVRQNVLDLGQDPLAKIVGDRSGRPGGEDGLLPARNRFEKLFAVAGRLVFDGKGERLDDDFDRRALSANVKDVLFGVSHSAVLA
jgi:hypothetical protein